MEVSLEIPNACHLAIRYFIVNVIVKVSSDEQSLVREKTYLNKLNMVLVQVC
jgi:exportin-1